jgi:hypothetical protein
VFVRGWSPGGKPLQHRVEADPAADRTLLGTVGDDGVAFVGRLEPRRDREVRPVADASSALRWRMEPEGRVEALAERVLKKGDVLTLDFGGHRTGYLSFRLGGVGRGVDAPVRLRLTFGDGGIEKQSVLDGLGQCGLRDPSQAR